MPLSKITAASAPRSSAARKSTIGWPPVSSSPSQAKRTLTGSSPAAASSAAAFSEHVELALVVGDAAAVEPVAALLELERVGLPELERIGRLHVEVPVDEHRRDRPGLSPDTSEADSSPTISGCVVGRHELRLAAGAADELGEPLRRARHVAACAGSALTLGMLESSASSSSQSAMTAESIAVPLRSMAPPSVQRRPKAGVCAG